MKICVTGAEGFIGSHLVEKLVKSGHSVKALVLYNSFNDIGNLKFIDKKKLSKLKIIFGDIKDDFFLHKNLNNCDVIINLAALISIPYSYNAPNSYIDNNLKGVLNLLNLATKNKKIHLILTSTSEVYGTAQYVPIDENHPINTQSPYAASKAACDNLAISYFKSFNTKVSILRPFNAFGPRQSLRAVIPTIITQAIEGKEIFIGSTSPTRDFTYVEDLCNAYLKVINNKNSVGEIINIASNFEISIKEIINEVSNILKKKLTVVSSEDRKRPKKSEVFRLYGSNKKAKKIIKWKPQIKGLKGYKKNLLKTIKWYVENKQSYDFKKKYIIYR
jgi:NAD dependent epimerase/dehydratase